MPIDYSKYHPQWKSHIRPKILSRAKFRCEQCSREHLKYYLKNDKESFGALDLNYLTWCAERSIPVTKIVLTIAHLNHDVTDNREENLKALCQRCHLNHDRPHNIAKRKTKSVNK